MKPPQHIITAALATGAALLATPALASAQDFCVGAPAGCSGTQVAGDQFAKTLTAAQSNGSADRFFVGVGTFDAVLSHKSLEKVEIIGSSRTGTVLRSSTGVPLSLSGNDGSKVSNLTVRPAGNVSVGLILLGTQAEKVDVRPDPASSALDAAVLLEAGGRFAHGSVKHGQFTIGVLARGAGGTVSDSSFDITEGVGVVGAGDETTVRRVSVKAAVGVMGARGHTLATDSLLDVRAPGNSTIGAFATTNTGLSTGDSNLDVSRVTIVGPPTSPDNAAGVAAASAKSGQTSNVTVRDSVISGFEGSLLRRGDNGGAANIKLDRSSYLPVSGPSASQGPGAITETNRITGAPGFVGANDFHLAAGSPLIDAGATDIADDALDADGKARRSDGNGDCKRVADIGAFEFQGTSVKAAAQAAVATAQVGVPVGFSSDGSCIPGPGVPSVRWSFDDGASADGAASSHAFTTPGRHTATATVRDAGGHSGSATAAVEVTAAPAPAPAPTPPPVVVPDGKPSTPAPRITKLRVKGKTIRFRLSRAASVDIRFAKVRRGGKLKRIKTRVKFAGHHGANRVKLPRGLRDLKPGAYRVIAVAKAADGRTSKPAKARFKVASHRKSQR
jgi:hypothetical protein